MFLKPQQILDQVSILQGWTVCDLGAGSGAYTVPLSVHVGDIGKVYAVDIQKDLLHRLVSEARAVGRHNIETIWGDAEKLGGTKVPSGKCDFVLAANLFTNIEKRDICVDEIARMIKSGGTVLVVDWSDVSHGLSKTASQALFEKKGFKLFKNIDAGSHHYGMIFKKA